MTMCLPRRAALPAMRTAPRCSPRAASTKSLAPGCSSNARTCNAWARSSSGARSTRCPGSTRRSARPAGSRSRPATMRRPLRWQRACWGWRRGEGGVIASSSGNHAQAIALAARLLGLPATIVMPQDAPASKIAATQGYGASVRLYDRYTQDREQISGAVAEREGLTLIPPYDHADVLAGQGTAAKELFEEVGPLDAFFVCLGGGGLLSGSALAT